MRKKCIFLPYHHTIYLLFDDDFYPAAFLRALPWSNQGWRKGNLGPKGPSSFLRLLFTATPKDQILYCGDWWVSLGSTPHNFMGFCWWKFYQNTSKFAICHRLRHFKSCGRPKIEYKQCTPFKILCLIYIIYK